MKVLIIIPAYNETGSIEHVVDNLVLNYPQYDYVVVNDCSTDNTEDILKKRGYKYLSLPVNLGIGGGVQSGYIYASQNDYDAAIQMDGDGQHDPMYIQTLLDPIYQGKLDMVVGSRFIEKKGFQTTKMRKLGIVFIKFIIKMCCGITISDTTSGFRATNKELIKLFAREYAQDYPEPESIVTAVLNGYRVGDVAVEMTERTGGKSSINTLRSVYYMIKVSLSLIVYRLGTKRKRSGAKA